MVVFIIMCIIATGNAFLGPRPGLSLAFGILWASCALIAAMRTRAVGQIYPVLLKRAVAQNF